MPFGRCRHSACTSQPSQTLCARWTAVAGLRPAMPTRAVEQITQGGRTIDGRTVAADLASMRLLEWRRAFCHQWPDETDEGWNVISLDDWKRATG
jgi:hypothetical protein